jgi:hypothetical protein
MKRRWERFLEDYEERRGGNGQCPDRMKAGTITPSTQPLRPHFHRSRDHDIGEIEEAKPARFQSTAQAVSWPG